MSDQNQDGNGEHGIGHVTVPTLIITLNPQTHLVSFQCDGIAVAVAQMMVDEVARQLDVMRKQAAQMELVKKLQDQERIAALMGSTRGRG